MYYRIPGILAAIKFGKIALDKYLVNLKFGNSHDLK